MEKVIAKSGISGSTLKLIAIFTMLIDHIAATVILQMINNGIGGQTLIDIYWVMRSIGLQIYTQQGKICCEDVYIRAYL